jgi:hypothetical protein
MCPPGVLHRKKLANSLEPVHEYTRAWVLLLSGIVINPVSLEVPSPEATVGRFHNFL